MARGPGRSVAMLAMLLVVVVALAGCGGGSSNDSHAPTAGPARSFMMGFSTVPRELNAQAYEDTFDLASKYGDMVLIQRTPKWSDFLPGASVGDDTANTTASEKKALSDKKLKLFFAIDPTDSATGRDRLADLPSSLEGHNFSDPAIRAAFVNYAKYVALNYKPAYLALGVEMNLYYEKHKDDFENFKTLYAQAYDEVKKISPDTQVTVTFQYEDLQGILPTSDSHDPDWELLRAFDPKLDLIAISTYPSFAFKSASAMPADYYSQIQAFADGKPVAIAEMGYSSAAGSQGINDGTEADQQAYVQRMLLEAAALKMPFIIWFAGWDPSFAADSPYSVFAHIGLISSDNKDKPAWAVWADAAARPYVPS